jgi:hypothetical protein
VQYAKKPLKPVLWKGLSKQANTLWVAAKVPRKSLDFSEQLVKVVRLEYGISVSIMLLRLL